MTIIPISDVPKCRENFFANFSFGGNENRKNESEILKKSEHSFASSKVETGKTFDIKLYDIRKVHITQYIERRKQYGFFCLKKSSNYTDGVNHMINLPKLRFFLWIANDS